MKNYLTEIIIGVIITVIGGFLLYRMESCNQPICKDVKIIYGTVVDKCNFEGLKNVEVDIDALVIKQNPSASNGKFEIQIKGCQTKTHRIKLKKWGYEPFSQDYEIDFESRDKQNLGELMLQPKKKCPVCDEITQMIYTLIDDSVTNMRRTIHNLGEATVSLDAAFEMELRDKLEPFLATNTIEEVDYECPEYHSIIKWVGRHNATPYEVGEYEIPHGQKVLIDTFISRIKQKQNEWEINFSKINCIGSADKQKVSSITIDRNKTGIRFSRGESFKVFYDGCNENTITSVSVIPVRFGDSAPYSVSPSNPITNNCGLSAARAFVMAKYLKDNLGRGVEIKYSAEGAIGNPGNNPDSRRVRIEITFKGAKKPLLN